MLTTVPSMNASPDPSTVANRTQRPAGWSVAQARPPSVRRAFGQREAHDEAGVAGHGLDRQVAAVPRDDDAIRDVQAQPGALADRLGGEERLEDALPDLGGMPGPVSPISTRT